MSNLDSPRVANRKRYEEKITCSWCGTTEKVDECICGDDLQLLCQDCHLKFFGPKVVTGGS